jgi:hypothetical protein
MSKEEKEIFDSIYEYVRTYIMGYDQNQSLSKTMVLRLKGLIVNKFIENYDIEDTANYPYLVVLNTFKFCKPDIEKALKNNSFQDENHKFNYVIKIVESNLNNVYMRMKNVKKTEEESENHDLSDAVNYINTFKAKNNDSKKSNKYNDLW